MRRSFFTKVRSFMAEGPSDVPVGMTSLVGVRYGALVCEGYAGPILYEDRKLHVWFFRCDCGARVIRLRPRARGGRQSCGCLDKAHVRTTDYSGRYGTWALTEGLARYAHITCVVCAFSVKLTRDAATRFVRRKTPPRCPQCARPGVYVAPVLQEPVGAPREDLTGRQFGTYTVRDGRSGEPLLVCACGARKRMRRHSVLQRLSGYRAGAKCRACGRGPGRPRTRYLNAFWGPYRVVEESGDSLRVRCATGCGEERTIPRSYFGHPPRGRCSKCAERLKAPKEVARDVA